MGWFDFLRKPPQNEFWTWLADNTARIQSQLKQDTQRVGHEIGVKLAASYPDLKLQLGADDQ